MFCRLLLVLSFLVGLKANATVASDHAGEMTRGLDIFERDVAKLLTDHCVKCHGGEKGVKGELDLSTRDLLMHGGEGGAAIVPGKSSESLLMKSIRHLDKDLKMPKKGEKLADTAIAKIAEWIDLGAPYGRALIEGKVKRDRSKVTAVDRSWWAFQPLAEPKLPQSATLKFASSNPIDRLILAKLEAKGIEPNPIAEKRLLIRRAYFDLIGLPPTPEEVDLFLKDSGPRAFEKVVDGLLSSPHYGERWGRHWLDLARYGESHGYEQDYDRPNAWHYRDYVIRALNADQPFDEFVRWQIAGDELAPKNLEAWKATGFLAAGTHATQITANQAEKERYDELDDIASTIGTSMLGLTVGCARCHDHKYDPIPTRDYYRLISTFTKTVRSDYPLGDLDEKYQLAKALWVKAKAEGIAARSLFEKERLPVLLADWESKGGVDPLPPAAVKGVLELAENQRTEAQRAVLLKWYRSQNAEWLKLDGAVNGLAAGEPKSEKITALIASEGVPAVRNHTQGPDFFEQTFFLSRGDLTKKQGEAPPGFLEVLTNAPENQWLSVPPDGARTLWRRASLARWLTDEKAGAGVLVARVIVNRLWQHHFGRGLVATPSDFGFQGEKPSHPELLDWLAGELIRSGWKLKTIHRLMMASAAYQRDGKLDSRSALIDPENLLVWRHDRTRLEGEVIRDSFLAVTGVLDRKMFGAGTLDAAMKRRSIYFQVKRSQLPAMMITFDAPDTLSGLGLRTSTTVAPQALLLMNNPQIRQASQNWAKQLLVASPLEAIQRAYQVALGRAPTEGESEKLLEFLRDQAASYLRSGKGNAAELAMTDFCQSVLSLNEFVYVD